MELLYIFNGEGSHFPSGVFSSLDNAMLWIKQYNLTGILNVYPIDIGLYDWAIEKNFFTPKQEYQRNPSFIGKFSCAYIKHYHIENGNIIAE